MELLGQRNPDAQPCWSPCRSLEFSWEAWHLVAEPAHLSPQSPHPESLTPQGPRTPKVVAAGNLDTTLARIVRWHRALNQNDPANSIGRQFL